MKNEQKMKKAYAAPSMRSVKLKYRANIMVGSVNVPIYSGGMSYADAAAENKEV